MRKPIVAGNWKIHMTAAEGAELAKGVVMGVQGLDGVEVVLCPPFTAVQAVGAAIKNTPVVLVSRVSGSASMVCRRVSAGINSS